MEKIYITHATSPTQRDAELNNAGGNGVRKFLVFENWNTDPKVRIISDKTPVQGKEYSLGTNNTNYITNSVVSNLRTTSSTPTLMTTMSNRMSIGHQNTFRSKFTNLMQRGSTSNTNAFSYLQNNLKNKYN